jgi:hypothetical protein
MPNLLLIDYLQRSRAQYSLHNVPTAYTAEESARLARIVPRRFANGSHAGAFQTGASSPL